MEVTADVSDAEVSVISSLAAVPAGHACVIEATPQLSPGISNANSKFRVIETLAAAATFPADVTASYTAKFGAIVAGQKMFVRAKMIVLATGEVSQKQVASTIVVA